MRGHRHRRLKKTREMIEMMCQSSGHAGGDAMTIYSGLGSEVRSLIMRNSSNGTSYGYNLTESGREGPPSVSSRITPIHARSESSTSLDVDGLLGAVVHMHLDGSRPGGSIGKGSGARSVLEAELEDGPEVGLWRMPPHQSILPYPLSSFAPCEGTVGNNALSSFPQRPSSP